MIEKAARQLDDTGEERPQAGLCNKAVERRRQGQVEFLDE
jgi:hypothetical protein